MYSAQRVVVVYIAFVVRLAYTWDIAVTAGDRIEFYTDTGAKTDTVRFNSQNLTALAYDEVHNELLYVDKQNDNDTICGYHLSSELYKCYIQRNGRNIQGLAFDPITETLFFTDTKERSINWFSFKPDAKNNVYGNMLIKMNVGIPTDIAVDSCRGYIYWINTNLPTSTIERAQFDGSKREVVIHAEYKWDLHNLAIGQQTQKIYWSMPETEYKRRTCSANLNGTNIKSLIQWTRDPKDDWIFAHPNYFAVSKKFLYEVSWCTNCGPIRVWKLPKPAIFTNDDSLFQVHTEGLVGIATNYKMKDQFEGISDCSHFLKNNFIDNSIKIAKEYEGPFCVHGTKVSGEQRCICANGYTGERCETSVCENYCLFGNCSSTKQGLPECSCEPGYSGERCEENVCKGYCLNSGTCSLNEEDEPVCYCAGDYEGHRCEVPVGLQNGDSSSNVGDSCQLVLDGKLMKIRVSSVPQDTTYMEE